MPRCCRPFRIRYEAGRGALVLVAERQWVWCAHRNRNGNDIDEVSTAKRRRLVVEEWVAWNEINLWTAIHDWKCKVSIYSIMKKSIEFKWHASPFRGKGFAFRQGDLRVDDWRLSNGGLYYSYKLTAINTQFTCYWPSISHIRFLQIMRASRD